MIFVILGVLYFFAAVGFWAGFPEEPGEERQPALLVLIALFWPLFAAFLLGAFIGNGGSFEIK